MRISLAVFVCLALFACKPPAQEENLGSIERLDPRLNDIIYPDAIIEKLADGFEWSEGPLWVEEYKILLFSDVPKNTIYQWNEGSGVTPYLTLSGYTGDVPRGGEPGSNGLLLDPEGRLVLCQHGDRRIAVMNASLDDPKPAFGTLAGSYHGMKFNSPNDAVYDLGGNLYFTDPPYGLAADSLREIPFQGVYRLGTNGELKLLIDSLTRPNGIALSPDESILYVSNSDSAKARWYAYQIAGDSLASGKVFYDATSLTSKMKGLPDGMKVDASGNIFATGPGGIFIFGENGQVLGKINLPNPSGNCALAESDKVLYITSDMNLLRIRLRR